MTEMQERKQLIEEMIDELCPFEQFMSSEVLNHVDTQRQTLKTQLAADWALKPIQHLRQIVANRRRG